MGSAVGSIGWVWNGSLFLLVCVVCAALAILDETIRRRHLAGRAPRYRPAQVRTRLRMGSLSLLILSLFLRSLWFLLRSSGGPERDDPGHGYFALGRLATCASFAAVSCCVLLWVVQLESQRLLDWQPRTMLQFEALVVFVNVIFTTLFCFAVLWARIENHSGHQGKDDKEKGWLDRYDNLIVSVFFTMAAIVVTVVSQYTLTMITRVVNLAVDAAEDLPPEARSERAKAMMAPTIRLRNAAVGITVCFFLRGVSWGASSVNNGKRVADGLEPFFYPMCFYTIPEIGVAMAVMCVVANADQHIGTLLMRGLQSSERLRSNFHRFSTEEKAAAESSENEFELGSKEEC